MDTLIDLVSEGAVRYADRPALLIRPSFRTRIWRFRDLGAVVPRAARVLREAGLEPGERVLIWAVNRPEWGIGFLAAAHAGGVSVPLDVRHTVEFATKVAAQTEARLVLASRQTAASARALGLPIVWIEQLPDLARRAESLPAAPITPDDLAEIVFTSGTTGEPKGAMLSHGNLMACAAAMTRVFPFRDPERLVSVLPLSHLYEQQLGFISPLSVGASVVYPVSRQPSVLLRTFRDFRPTTLLIVPQGLRLLDNAIERRIEQAGRRPMADRLHRLARPLPNGVQRLMFGPLLGALGGRLRTVGVGASALDVPLAEHWMDYGVDVLQGYGATEMGPVISFTHPDRNRLGTVGEPIPGVEVRIADDGEILARGPNRFLGYWRNPDATARAIDADGWYHTGDLGTLSPDGFLTFRGRKKDMLALPDGQKVYPEDVEAVLEKDDRVIAGTVVGWPVGPDLKVHAVLILDDPAHANAVVREANAHLGAHQQIRGVTIWPDEDLPRTNTLKVRKFEVLARLPELEAAGGPASGAASGTLHRDASASAAGVDEVTAIVAGIAGIAASAVPDTARLSSDLQLDSLQRVELLGIIEEELGVYIDDDALDPEATVLELRGLVDANRGAKRGKGIFGWPLSPAVRAVGIASQAVLIKPLVFASYRVRTTGLERLEHLTEPVLLTPNHCLHLDNAIILSRLPLAVRWHLSFAAAADTIYDNPFQGFAATVLANAFPLQREGGVRHSLEMLGARLDRGFNVVIYPEGKLTVGGPIQPFKAGAGLIAVEGATPVIPIRLHVHRISILDRRRLPSRLRGDVELVIGEPLLFDASTDPAEATARMEAALRAL